MTPAQLVVGAANTLEPPLPLATQFIDLGVKPSYHLQGLFDGRSELATFALPPTNTVHLRRSSSHLRVDLLAELAFLADGYRLHDQLHAARFTDTVLPIAVLSEVTPLPIAARKTVLIEEAHVSGAGQD